MLANQNASSSSCPVFSGDIQLLNHEEKIGAVALYTCVALLAFCGNCGVIFIVTYFKRMRTAANCFIGNLALADLLMAAMCIPFSYWSVLVLQYWSFGLVMCKVIHFLQVLAVMLSAHTLIVISIDRFRAIMYPLRHQLSNQQALRIIAGVWLLDVTIATPILFVQTLANARVVNETSSSSSNSSDVVVNKTLYDCSEHWDSEQGAFVYSQVLLIVQYFLPLSFVLVTYAGIGLKLWLSHAPGESALRTDQHRKDSMRKLITTMFLVSFMYTLCWLPQNVLTLLWTRCASYMTYPYILHIWWGCHLTAMSYSCVNPLIYLITSPRFRQGYLFIVQRLFCFHRSAHPNSTNLILYDQNSAAYANTNAAAADSSHSKRNSRSNNNRRQTVSSKGYLSIPSSAPNSRNDCI